MADLLDLPIERYAHDGLIPRIWELRESFSAYDATYVDLAEAVAEKGAPLLTADTRLARPLARTRPCASSWPVDRGPDATGPGDVRSSGMPRRGVPHDPR